MDQVKWKRIEEVFYSALSVSEEERGEFLDRACGGDDELRAEVESLLPEHAESDNFLSESLLTAGLAALAESEPRLSAGHEVGPYIIRRFIARGGSGSVYLATDSRLDRPVALKFLRQDYAVDGSGRFGREVRAASSVSHENIAHIYGAGTFESTNYIAMEYVEGTSLREIIDRGSIPFSDAISIASQTARALAAAHAGGVVHRDIKPENLIVRDDGVVKVLDFGLAKLGHGRLAPSTTEALSFRTPPGLVLGTVRYMSPEQVRGTETDERTDIWSLGVVIFEMLNGERPFDAETDADTLTAILGSDIKFRSDVWERIPPMAVGIIRRCLAKYPKDRFQSAADLAFALDSMGAEAARVDRECSPPMQNLAQSTSRLPLHLILPILLAAGCVLGITGIFFSGSFNPWWQAVPSPVYKQLTFQRGTVWNARFSGRSDSVLYSATWGGEELAIFELRLSDGESRRLGLPNTKLLSVSSRNEAAVLENERHLHQFIHRGRLGRIGVEGEVLREMTSSVQEADWAPDGETLAVVRSADGGGNKLEFPTGRVLFKTSGRLSSPRVAPDGSRIAYVEHERHWDGPNRLAVIDSHGRRTVLLDGWADLGGVAWKGDEVWFTGSRNGEKHALYAIKPGGRDRLVTSSPDSLYLHDIASDGRVLLSRELIWSEMHTDDLGGGHRELFSTRHAALADYSRDGSMILFTAFGAADESTPFAFIQTMDGSSAKKIGKGRALALSPDGQSIAVKANGEEALTILSADTGETISLRHSGIEQIDQAAWLPDGSSLLFIGNEIGRPGRTFLADKAGRDAKPVTPEGLAGTVVSPDGRFMFARNVSGEARIVSLDGQEETVVNGLQEGEEVVRWHPDGGALLIYNPMSLPIRIWRLEPQSGRREIFHEIRPTSLAGVLGRVIVLASADAKSFVYGLPRRFSDLYLVEGLK